MLSPNVAPHHVVRILELDSLAREAQGPGKHMPKRRRVRNEARGTHAAAPTLPPRGTRHTRVMRRCIASSITEGLLVANTMRPVAPGPHLAVLRHMGTRGGGGSCAREGGAALGVPLQLRQHGGHQRVLRPRLKETLAGRGDGRSSGCGGGGIVPGGHMHEGLPRHVTSNRLRGMAVWCTPGRCHRHWTSHAPHHSSKKMSAS